MTRAKDRLIMTYYSKHLLSELKNINSQLTMPLRDDLCASARNPGKWILMAALCRTEAGEILNLVEGNDVSAVQEHPWKIVYRDLAAQQDITGPEISQERTDIQSADQTDLALLQFDYPFRHASSIPAKMTATQLKGRMQDQEVSEGAAEPVKSLPSFRKASFLPGTMTAAEKGTATHLFMQFADYHACTAEGTILAELQRLQTEAFLLPEQAEAVRVEQILTFFRSQLGQWLLAQTQIRREFKFSIFVDAETLFPGTTGEQIMLQGVVDCFVIETDGITILDFKTDHVGNQLQKRAMYYRSQLESYAAALSRIYGMPVKRKILWFFQAGEGVEI